MTTKRSPSGAFQDVDNPLVHDVGHSGTIFGGFSFNQIDTCKWHNCVLWFGWIGSLFYEVVGSASLASIFSFEDMIENNQNLPESDEDLWITERVAKYLHVSLKTVFNLRKKMECPLSKWGEPSASFHRKSKTTCLSIAAWLRIVCVKSCEKEPGHDPVPTSATQCLF